MSINRLASPARLLVAVVLLVGILSAVIIPVVHAAPYNKLSTRSLRTGTSEPGAETDYIISMSWPTNTAVGSIRFILCLDYLVDEPCANAPDGDLSGAVLTAQTGVLAGTGGFSIDAPSTQQDELLIVRNFAELSGTGMNSVTLDDVINPSIAIHRYYIQIFSYTSIDGTGTPTNMSSVATATTTPISINADVPPILYFCAALTISEWCTNVNGNYIDYGDLSPAQEDAAISQFGVATNAAGGYVVTANGNTMSSGVNLIQNLTTLTANTPGSPQFGINLRANTNPANGLDAFGTGIGTVAPGYDTPDVFQYNDGDMVALGLTGTMFNTFTVTYIVNVPPDQAAGVYNTTITYICTAAF